MDMHRKEQPMRLELGTRVYCNDESVGKLADVVIDPIASRVTHLVVEPDRERWLARLVPIELAEPAPDTRGAITLRTTMDEVRRLPPVHRIAYLQLDGLPVADADWDLGIQEVLALPYYPAYDLEPTPYDYTLTYDRVPKNEVEIRRASSVHSADGHRLGHVDGFVVDHDEQINHLVLERGHPWGRREITIPVGAVAKVETDAVVLNLTKDEVGMLPEVRVQRWPMSGLPARPTAPRLFGTPDDEAAEREEYGGPASGEAELERYRSAAVYPMQEAAEAADANLASFKRPPDPAP
jgi:sporulation protein YlmC with PRC-barrel domain